MLCKALHMTERPIHSLQERKLVRIFTGSKQFLSIIFCCGILSAFFCVLTIDMAWFRALHIN